ncbi:uncharacterized protein CDAR_45501 [Caerostris darwini]|uniref:Uncharacterized protein n=1 Tax=Caerostris darwini TaxID=1538125 RepID=A0AAV4M483_9ARAC|nr:uncharacterized protein CDAR_45501 [Caerostris darwini]
MDLTLLSIPKAGALDKYPIPAPKDLQIKEFAMWKRCPTDQKHPVQKRPRKEIEFYRSKIGEQLHLRYPGKKFDQTGTAKPRIPTLTYNSLNDPYMRHYFRTLPSYKDLVDKGLVTADGKVRVDIKEFNQYRMYLHHIWTMEIDHLRRTQEMEEHKRLETLLKAVENEDSICKNIVDKQDFVNADLVMEELEKKDDILDRIKHPLVRSMLNWKYYQLRLRRDYKKDYPFIQKWLTDQTKHYKSFMEKKITARKIAFPLRQTSRKQSKSVQPSDETPGKTSRETKNAVRKEAESVQKNLEQKQEHETNLSEKKRKEIPNTVPFAVVVTNPPSAGRPTPGPKDPVAGDRSIATGVSVTNFKRIREIVPVVVLRISVLRVLDLYRCEPPKVTKSILHLGWNIYSKLSAYQIYRPCDYAPNSELKSKDPSIEDARKSSSSSSDSTSHTPMENYTWEDESDNTRNTFNTSDNNSDEPQRKGSDDDFAKSPPDQKWSSDTWTPVSEKQDDDFAKSPPDPKWSSDTWTPVSDKQGDDFAKSLPDPKWSSGSWTPVSDKQDDERFDCPTHYMDSVRKKLKFSESSFEQFTAIRECLEDDRSPSSQQSSSIISNKSEEKQQKKITFPNQGKKKQVAKERTKISSPYAIPMRTNSVETLNKDPLSREKQKSKGPIKPGKEDKAVRTPKRYSSLDPSDSSVLHNYLYGLPSSPEETKSYPKSDKVTRVEQAKKPDRGVQKTGEESSNITKRRKGAHERKLQDEIQETERKSTKLSQKRTPTSKNANESDKKDAEAQKQTSPNKKRVEEKDEKTVKREKTLKTKPPSIAKRKPEKPKVMEKETSSMSSAQSKDKDKTFKLTTLFSRKEPHGKHKKETETEKETKSKKEKAPKSRVSHTKKPSPKSLSNESDYDTTGSKSTPVKAFWKEKTTESNGFTHEKEKMKKDLSKVSNSDKETVKSETSSETSERKNQDKEPLLKQIYDAEESGSKTLNRDIKLKEPDNPLASFKIDEKNSVDLSKWQRSREAKLNEFNMEEMRLKADAKFKTSSETCEKKSQNKETLLKQTYDAEESGSKIINTDVKLKEPDCTLASSKFDEKSSVDLLKWKLSREAKLNEFSMEEVRLKADAKSKTSSETCEKKSQNKETLMKQTCHAEESGSKIFNRDVKLKEPDSTLASLKFDEKSSVDLSKWKLIGEEKLNEFSMEEMKLKADAKSKTSSETCEKESQSTETLLKQTYDAEESGSKILKRDAKLKEPDNTLDSFKFDEKNSVDLSKWKLSREAKLNEFRMEEMRLKADVKSETSSEMCKKESQIKETLLKPACDAGESGSKILNRDIKLKEPDSTLASFKFDEKNSADLSKWKLFREARFNEFSKEEMRLKADLKLREEFKKYLNERNKEKSTLKDSPERKSLNNQEILKEEIRSNIKINENRISPLKHPLIEASKRSLQNLKKPNRKYQQNIQIVSDVVEPATDETTLRSISPQKFKDDLKRMEDLKRKDEGTRLKSDEIYKELVNNNASESNEIRSHYHVKSVYEIKRDLNDYYFLFHKLPFLRKKHTSYEPMTSPTSGKEEENLEVKILRSPDTKLFNLLGEERRKKLKDEFIQFVLHERMGTCQNERFVGEEIPDQKAEIQEFFKQIYLERKRNLDKELARYIASKRSSYSNKVMSQNLMFENNSSKDDNKKMPKGSETTKQDLDDRITSKTETKKDFPKQMSIRKGIVESSTVGKRIPRSTERTGMNEYEKKRIFKIDGRKYLYFTRISVPWDSKISQPLSKDLNLADVSTLPTTPHFSSRVGFSSCTHSSQKQYELFLVNNSCQTAEKISPTDSNKGTDTCHFIESTDVSVIDHSTKFERVSGFSMADLISNSTKTARGLEYVCTTSEPLIKISDNMYISPNETSFGKKALSISPAIKTCHVKDLMLEDVKIQLIDSLHKLLNSTAPALCDLKQAEEYHCSEYYAVCAQDVKKLPPTQLESVMKASSFEIDTKINLMDKAKEFLYAMPLKVGIQNLDIADEKLDQIITNFEKPFNKPTLKFVVDDPSAKQDIYGTVHQETEDFSKMASFPAVKKDPQFQNLNFPISSPDAYYSKGSKSQLIPCPISAEADKIGSSIKEIDVSDKVRAEFKISDSQQKYHSVAETLPSTKPDITVANREKESNIPPHFTKCGEALINTALPDAYYGTGSKSAIIPRLVLEEKNEINEDKSETLHMNENILRKSQKYHSFKKILPPSVVTNTEVLQYSCEQEDRQKYHTLDKTLPPPTTENAAADKILKSKVSPFETHEVELPDAYYGTFEDREKYHTLDKTLPPPVSKSAAADKKLKSNVSPFETHEVQLPDAYYGTFEDRQKYHTLDKTLPPPVSKSAAADKIPKSKVSPFETHEVELPDAYYGTFEDRQKYHTLDKTLPPPVSKSAATDKIEKSKVSPFETDEVELPDAYYGTFEDRQKYHTLDKTLPPPVSKSAAADKIPKSKVSPFETHEVELPDAYYGTFEDRQKYHTLDKTLPPPVSKSAAADKS